MTAEPVAFRDARSTDVPALLAIYEPLIRDSIVTFETEPPTEAEFAARVERSHLWLVGTRGDHVTGYAYAAAFHARAAYRWSAEVSVYVHPDHHRSGVARTLLQELLDRLATMGFVNAFAGVALPNDASVRLFEAFGFERVALQKQVGFKLDRWIDVGWWQKHLRDRTTPPPELVI